METLQQHLKLLLDEHLAHFGRYNGRDSSSSLGLINGRELPAVPSPPSALLRSAALALLRIRLASVAYAARVDAIRPSSCVCWAAATVTPAVVLDLPELQPASRRLMEENLFGGCSRTPGPPLFMCAGFLSTVLSSALLSFSRCLLLCLFWVFGVARFVAGALILIHKCAWLLPAEVFFFEDGLKTYAAKSRLFSEVVVVSMVGIWWWGWGREERQRNVLGDFQSSVVVEEREKHRKESSADGRRRCCLMFLRKP